MFWMRKTPVLYLALGLLIAGDLGSHIFADANALECTYAWNSKEGSQSNYKHNCDTVAPGVITLYQCSWCGRGDRKIPSALNCIDPNGHALDTKGSWNCDAGMDVDESRDRPISCYHTDRDGVAREYQCKSRHLNQQCPFDKCIAVGSNSH
ncbi:secreted protein [Melampsora americana]|nr:secreted protein [Melampsora americana]